MKLSHVSPSQFRTFDLCRRKWYIEKCTGLPRSPPSRGQALGSAVHADLEAWALGKPEPKSTTDRVRSLAALAAEQIGDLPAAVVDGEALIERRIWLDEDIAPPMLGFIDVLDGRGGVVTVVDYKTTTSIEKYGQSPESLAVDLQMVPYALWTMRELDLDRAQIAHVQIQTKGEAKACKIISTITRDAADKQWREYFVPRAAEMRALAASGSAVEFVEPTYTACSAFGGCPHAQTCLALRKVSDTPEPPTPFGRLTTNQGNKMADLRSLMATKSLRTAGATEPEAVALAGQLVSGDLDRGAWPELAKALLAKHRAAFEVPSGINPPERIDERIEKPLGKASRKTPAEYAALALALHAAVNLSSKGSLSPAAVSRLVREHFATKRVSRSHIEEACYASEGRISYAKGGRVDRVGGAFPNSAEVAADPIEVAVAVAEVVRPEPEPVVDPESPRRVEPSPRATEGLTLYVDCRTVKLNGAGPALTFAELVEPLVGKVAKANGVADPLLMDYGKGRFEVAALLRGLLPISGVVLVDSRNPYWGECSHVLGVVAETLVYGA